MAQLITSKNNIKGFISLFNNIFSKFLFVLFSIQILKYNGKCTNNEPYKDLDICTSDCNQEQLFIDKTCIPVSVSNNHIEEMTEKILTYIEDYNSPEDIVNDIIIEGEGITYQISNNNLIKNQNNGNSLINIDFGNKCLNNLNDFCENFFIILINVINTNFTTTKGILMISENENYELLLDIICQGENITYGIPISIPQKTKAIYKEIKEKYNYDIFNLNSSFYTDICELYETEDNLDMSLTKRDEVFGSHGIDVCSNNCQYKKYDIDKNKVYCECKIISDEESENDSKSVGQQIYDSLADFLDLINFDVMFCVKLVYSGGAIGLFKNYGFIIMTLVAFLYIISMIIAFCIINKTVKKILDNFAMQKQKFKNMLDEEEKKLEKENNNKKKEAQNINVPILRLNEDQNRIKKNEEEYEEEEEEEEEDDEEEEEEEDDDEEMEEEEDDEDIKKNNKDNNNNKNLIEKNNNNINNDENNEDELRKKRLLDLENERKKLDDYYKKRDELRLDDKKDSIKPPSIKLEREEPNYLDYYRQQYYYYNYYNYYNNYMQYMNQYYQRNLQNMNMQQQQQSQPPPQPDNSNLNKLRDNDVIKLVIPYDKIIENIKKAKREKKEKKEKRERKKSRNKTKEKKSTKKIHNKSTKGLSKKKGKKKEKRSDFENPERVIRMPKKRKTKNKTKTKKKKEQKPMQFDIKLPDNIKANPPKAIKIRNNENLISSRNKILKNNMEDSKKSDISVYKLNSNKHISNIKRPTNDKNKKNIKINENDLTLSSIRNQQNENKEKEKENENEINNNENKIKFGSDEFYKSLLKIPEEKRKEFFENDELNFLEYQYALLYDKRSFCEIYLSVLKKQNTLILCFSYCSKDYNLGILKFSFLMFQFAIFITISAFFFTDNTLNNIYENKNKFDIPFMVRQLALTFLICLGLNIIFKFLMTTDNLILRMKYEKESFDEGIHSIKCKLILYFIFCLLIILFGWYYIGCFCAIYRNTQIILMKCAGYSLCVTFVYQIFFSLLSPSFRKCAVNSEAKDKKCLYEFSKILSYL